MPDDPLCRIAFEKASIARPGVPLVTQEYPLAVARTVIELRYSAGVEGHRKDKLPVHDLH